MYICCWITSTLAINWASWTAVGRHGPHTCFCVFAKLAHYCGDGEIGGAGTPRWARGDIPWDNCWASAPLTPCMCPCVPCGYCALFAQYTSVGRPIPMYFLLEGCSHANFLGNTVIHQPSLTHLEFLYYLFSPINKMATFSWKSKEMKSLAKSPWTELQQPPKKVFVRVQDQVAPLPKSKSGALWPPLQSWMEWTGADQTSWAPVSVNLLSGALWPSLWSSANHCIEHWTYWMSSCGSSHWLHGRKRSRTGHICWASLHCWRVGKSAPTGALWPSLVICRPLSIEQNCRLDDSTLLHLTPNKRRIGRKSAAGGRAALSPQNHLRVRLKSRNKVCTYFRSNRRCQKQQKATISCSF